MNKKTLLTIAAAAAITVAALYYFAPQALGLGARENGTREDGTRIFTEGELRSAFQKVAQQRGADFARQLERLFRWETGHFESGQYMKTLSPGMTTDHPEREDLGWSSLPDFLRKYPQYNGKYYTVFFPSTSAGPKYYIGFPTPEAAIMFVAYNIAEKKGGNFGAWNSLSPAAQQDYINDLATIRALFV